MARAVRRVARDWQHPIDDQGEYIPLWGGSFSECQRQWEEHNAKWNEGLRENFLGSGLVPVEDEFKQMSLPSLAVVDGVVAFGALLSAARVVESPA